MTAVIRAARSDDEPFIRNSWLKSLRNVQPYKDVPNAIYYVKQNKVLDAIFKDSYVLVAADPEDDSCIWGWVCFGQTPLGSEQVPVLHYVYVKNALRGFGVARELLNAASLSGHEMVIASVWTPRMSESKLRHEYKLIADPFVAWEKLEND